MQSSVPAARGAAQVSVGSHLAFILGSALCMLLLFALVKLVLHLSGAPVREVLAQGCPLDLHPSVFGAGQCAQSHFFKLGQRMQCSYFMGAKSIDELS